MRISDWSSDVCSSDLRLWPLGTQQSPGRRQGADSRGPGPRRDHCVADEFYDLMVRCSPPCVGHRLEVPGLLTPLEIGRASCRASLCQSVYISVVAVSFKKTTSHVALCYYLQHY